MTIRRITVFAAVIVKAVLTYTDNAAGAAPPGRSPPPPSGYDAIQQLNYDRQQPFRQTGNRQQSDDNNLDDKIINNVYIQVFLNAANRSVTGSNNQPPASNGFLHGTNLLNGRNSSPPLGSQQNPIAFKIDLVKGVVSEIDNDKPVSRATATAAAATTTTANERTVVENSKITSVFAQNPHETSDSLLRDESFSPDEQRTKVSGFHSFTLAGAERRTSQAIPETTFSASPRKGNVTVSAKAHGTTGEGKQLPKEFEKALNGEIEPLTQSRPSTTDTISIADKSSLDTDIDEAIGDAAAETGISASNATVLPIPSAANTFRSGKLASSHIVDYSRFSTKTPPADPVTLPPESGPLSAFSEQSRTTATISVADKGIPLEQVRQLTTSQQHFGVTPTTAGPETLTGNGHLDRTTTTNNQAVGFQTLLANSESSATAISDNILPFEPLVTTTAYPSVTTPSLVVFTNKTPRLRATTAVASKKITVMAVNPNGTSKSTDKLPKMSPDNRALYLALAKGGTIIPVGDREILDEQMHPLEVSVHSSTPRLVVGERINGMQETHVPDSSAESEFETEISWTGKPTEPEIDAGKSAIPSGIVETQPSESLTTFQSSKSTQKDPFSRETTFNPEKKLVTSAPRRLQSANSVTVAFPETSALVAHSGHQPEESSPKSESESTHSAGTHLADVTESTGLKLPDPSLNPSLFEILSDEATSTEYNGDSETGFVPDSTTLPMTPQVGDSSSQTINQVELITSPEISPPPSGSIRIGDKSRMKENLEIQDNVDEDYEHPNSFSTGNVITSTSGDSTGTLELVGSSLSSEVGKELEKELEREEGTGRSSVVAKTTAAVNKATTGSTKEEIGEAEVSEPSYCEAVAANGGECPVANDKSDRTRSDVLFLIDASSSIGKQHFQQALNVIKDAVQQFKNIGPDGVQVSLVQFTHEPVLEFSFRKHNCKPCLIADIADTEYMNGVSNLGNAIQKATKYGFSRRRGDREDAENILVVISDGASDDQLREPLQQLRDNNITVMVVSSEDANPELIMQLVSGNRDNLFNISATGQNLTADQLAQRVRIIAQEKSTSRGTTVTMMHDETIRGFGAQCLSDGFNVTFLLLKSFGGIIAVRGKSATEGCSKMIQAEQFGENITSQEVNLFIGFKQCDVEETISTNPPGKNYSVVVNVMHDKWLVTGADRGFLLQCYRSGRLLEQDVNIDLNVLGGIKIAETLPLSSIPPLCKYTIRKDTPNGPIVQSASLDDVIYHRWECEADHTASDVYGLLIHDCYAESDTKQKHVIIDNKGCSADASIMGDAVYADDQLLAFAHAKVFTFTDSEHLSFHCKLSLCTRKADGCEGITPPQCPRSGHSDLLVYRRARHSTESFLAALTTDEEAKLTLSLSGNGPDPAFSLQTVEQFTNANLFWLMIILTALSVAVALMLIRHIYKINNQSNDEFTISECYSQRQHGILDRAGYVTASSLNCISDFVPVEKINREPLQIDTSHYRGLLKKVVPREPEIGAGWDEKQQTENISVSLNSTYEEIRPPMGLSPRRVPVTESLHVVLDPT